MHVDTHLLGNLQQLEWEYLPIRHDDEIVTIICADFVQKLLVIPNLHGLQYRSIMGECEFLHRALLHDLVSSEGLVRIGHDEYDLALSIRK